MRAVLIVCAVLALAAVATSASFDHEVGDFVCDACKSLVAQTKGQIPQLKPQIEQLCQYCGAEANVKKCLAKIDEVLDKMAKESPEEICQELSLCKKKSLQSLMGF